MRACEDSERFQAEVNALQNDLTNFHRLKNDYNDLKASEEYLQKEILNKDNIISELT
jgi:hypothetical protein